MKAWQKADQNFNMALGKAAMTAEGILNEAAAKAMPAIMAHKKKEAELKADYVDFMSKTAKN